MRFATSLIPPPAPEICNVNDPVGAFWGIVTVRSELKVGVPEETEKKPLAPEGNPETDRVTGELNPFWLTTLIWYVIVSPGVAVWDGGVASILKSGACPMVSRNVVGCEVDPAVPVIVNEYCPGATEAVVVMDSIDVKLGVPEVGLNEAETPLGAPETVKATL